MYIEMVTDIIDSMTYWAVNGWHFDVADTLIICGFPTCRRAQRKFNCPCYNVNGHLRVLMDSINIIKLEK